MPNERTRALRWGWELLLELQSSDSLTPQQSVQVDELLLHYPAASELKRWAALEDTSQLINELGVEVDDAEIERVDVPQDLERQPVSVEQYTHAIVEAGVFFRALLAAENLTDSIRRQVPYVLRHYPQSYNIFGIKELVARASLKK
jgi:hypothetical protein